MSSVSNRYDGLEYYDLADVKRLIRRWLIRFFVTLFPHRVRVKFDPNRWPVGVRARFKLATAHELADLERERTHTREQKRLKKELKKRAREYKKLIRESLAKAGAVYKFTDEGRRYYRKIKFARIKISLDGSAIYYFFDIPHLPDLVLISFLKNEEVLETISGSCQRVVEALWDRWHPEKGFAYRVQLRQGVRGIPSNVDFSVMLEALEKRSKSTGLTLIMGAGENGNAMFGELNEFPHLLVAGATGTGKSVWTKQAMLTLALRNDPRDLKFLLVDLKGGVELRAFRGLPHVLKMVKAREEVKDILQMAMDEVNKRMAMFERIGVVDIGQYKARRYIANEPLPRLPYWVVVIDELANVMLERDLRNQVENLLSHLAAEARAAGVFLIMATQRPSVDVITGIIKANISVRVAFGTASMKDSQVIIDTSEAHGLSPSGRMIFMRSKDKTELQGPFISPTMIDDKIAGIIGGQREETLQRSKRHDFTPIDFFLYALLKCDGKVTIKDIYDHFRPFGVSRMEVETALKQYANQQIELEGNVYLVEDKFASGSIKAARRLVKQTFPDPIPKEEPRASPTETNSGDLSEFQGIPISDSRPPEQTDLSPKVENISESQTEPDQNPETDETTIREEGDEDTWA